MGTPTYIPQNDPDDTLIILNINKRAQKQFSKTFWPSAQGPISQGPTRRLGRESKIVLLVFNQFCIFHKILSILSTDT